MVRAQTAAPSLVLFDMDDTLFDHALTCRAALEEVQMREPRLGTRPLDTLWREYLRMLDAQSAGFGVAPALYRETRAERFARLGALCGWTMSPAEAEELSRRYRRYYQRLRRPVPGGPEFVRRVARHARVGVVTNNELEEQEDKLRYLGLSDVVDLLVVSGEEKIAKPDPRIYRIALERAGARARDATMVGDSWTNDVLGARGAGIRPVWFNRFVLPAPTRHRVDEISSFRPFADAHATVRGARRRSGHPRR
jgi:HAD superfamily hydrolase (TIGR01549 family)